MSQRSRQCTWGRKVKQGKDIKDKDLGEDSLLIDDSGRILEVLGMAAHLRLGSQGLTDLEIREMGAIDHEHL